MLHRSWNQTRLVLMVSMVLVLVRLSGAATISLPPTPPPAPIFSCSDRPAPSSVLLGTYSAIQLSHSSAFRGARIFSLSVLHQISFSQIYSCSVSLSCNFLKAFFMLWSVLTRGMSYLLQLGLLASPRSPTITFAAKISAYHRLIK